MASPPAKLTPLTDEQKRYALQAARIIGMKRYTVVEITRELDGVTHVETVRSDQAMALGPGGNPRKLSGENDAEMARAYQAGESCDVIGRKWGISGVTVMKALHRLGVEMRPRKSGGRHSLGNGNGHGTDMTPATRRRVEQALASGSTPATVALTFGVALAEVERISDDLADGD